MCNAGRKRMKSNSKRFLKLLNSKTAILDLSVALESIKTIFDLRELKEHSLLFLT